MTILDDILDHKRREVAAARRERPADALAREAEAVTRPPLGLRRALDEAGPGAVIAEIKRRSPSKGELRPDLDPVACARAYRRGGAAGLSVLTDERFFGGSLDDLRAVRADVALPLLRKDFLVDASQVDEARLAGADAILLIVAALERGALRELDARARALGLDVLVEVHDEAELEIALELGAGLVGVNNRDLRTFETDVATTERLAARVPDSVLLVSESGIASAADVARVVRAGARAVLVGESLMREEDLAAALGRLRGRPETETIG